MTVGQRIKSLRKSKDITQTELGAVLGVEKSTISMYENDNSSPNYDALTGIAKYFNVTTDYILGFSTDPELTRKDERDILKKLDSILSEMNGADALMFDGEEVTMDDESVELLKSSLENSIRLAKKLAKEKYTPNKYKK